MSLARYTDGSSTLLKATKLDVEIMLNFRPKHPLTLQSARLLAQFLQKPEVPLRMMEGTLSAMHQYLDPAQALQHLLHCMYSELMVCTQSSWHVLSAHDMYSDPAQAVPHVLHCMYSELTMCTQELWYELSAHGMSSVSLYICTALEVKAQRMCSWDMLSAHGMAMLSLAARLFLCLTQETYFLLLPYFVSESAKNW